ncbi:hypothetical protein RGUI_2384 [Rhodovulum sp. P5]|uniref:hypothetical protein n=1 Tax=Rhodovulum sp. P5 TaxID=1564506 RepID=UPI0009C22970|nr:hypothetical protein [Rhodovulum sp. P5]ARE40525.1 hypothetical protein RGUI_2384 [Rhodovulum sp. P5]
METNAFGTVRLDDGQATLPVGPGVLRPVGLDFLATVQDRPKMEAAATFIDTLSKHVETVRVAFLDGYDSIAANVPAWLHENAPAAYAALFPDTPNPADITPAQLWDSLDMTAIWSRDDGIVTIAFGFHEVDVPRSFAAEFQLDGALQRVAFVA